MSDRPLAVPFSSIVIVGRGLIGGSIEEAVRQREPSAHVRALDRGDELSAVASADLVILAAPVLTNIALLGSIRGGLGPGTLVTDVGSTKAAIVAAAEGLRFVGGHPIAGAAHSGREHARADLFVGRPWILTRSARTAPDVATRMEDFVRTLGGVPRWMDPDEHDRTFAFLSHLPQLAISTLTAVIGDAVGPDGLALAGSGLRDSTRLAGSPQDLWADVLATNRPAIRDALDGLIVALQRLRDDTTDGTMRQLFEQAAAARLRLNRPAD